MLWLALGSFCSHLRFLGACAPGGFCSHLCSLGASCAGRLLLPALFPGNLCTWGLLLNCVRTQPKKKHKTNNVDRDSILAKIGRLRLCCRGSIWRGTLSWRLRCAATKVHVILKFVFVQSDEPPLSHVHIPCTCRAYMYFLLGRIGLGTDAS